MKQFCLFPLIALVSILAVGRLEAGEKAVPWSFHTELDLYLGMKAGAEYRFSDLFGIRGSAGICLINPLGHFAYNLVGVFHLRQPQEPFQFDIHGGVIYANFVLPSEENGFACYWNPGFCLAVGLRTRGGHVFRLRGGAGIACGYDSGAWEGPDLMPNIGIEYAYSRWE